MDSLFTVSAMDDEAYLNNLKKTSNEWVNNRKRQLERMLEVWNFGISGISEDLISLFRWEIDNVIRLTCNQ